ncbi:MAG TPA: galactokinase, partial [Polyangiaceae bacterium]|nr:galactokinase [Polyangiaceae bacterium]
MNGGPARARAVATRFRERFGGSPQVFSAPGRVNLIGEHTDYSGGLAFPLAVAERTWVATVRRPDRTVRAYSLELRKERTFSLDAAFERRGKWLDYVEGVARALIARGVAVPGADLYVTSDVPLGAGLSSSAALELAVGLALTTLAGATLPPFELARVGQSAENEFVGVRSGVMDQLASALGREGHALFIDCRSLEVTPVAIPDAEVELVVADTAVKHSHAASGYNQRRAECQRALEVLAEKGRPVESLRELSVEGLEPVLRLLPDPLGRRVRHVVSENARTAAAVDALRRGHFTSLGRLMNGSHASLRDDYE